MRARPLLAFTLTCAAIGGGAWWWIQREAKGPALVGTLATVPVDLRRSR